MENNRFPEVAAHKSPRRDSQPGASGVTPGQPFPISPAAPEPPFASAGRPGVRTSATLHRAIDPATIARLNGEDDQLYRAIYEPDPVDAIRRRLVERSRLERIIAVAAIGLCVFIVGYFAAQYLRAVFTAGHAFGGLIGGVS